METGKSEEPKTPAKKSVHLTVPDLWKALTILLIIALAVCIWLWKPWQATPKASDRTVSVSGSATVTAEPDEFVFSPNYEFNNPDKQAGLAEVSKKSDEVIAKLKTLGVADSKIKTNSTNYDAGIYSPTPDAATVYTLNLTVTVGNKSLAQKVQDYLLTTNPSGLITPQASFSKDKQRQLESQARDKAEKDARAKADQSAKNLGFSLGKVKSVQDGGFNNEGCGKGMLCPISNTLDSKTAAGGTPQLGIQPGENDLSYGVTVVYYLH